MTALKFNFLAIVILIAQGTAKTESEALNDNKVSTNEEAPQHLYSVVPQAYYIPQVYQANPSDEYSSLKYNQNPIAFRQKAYLAPTYKVPFDTSKYTVATVVAKQPQATHSNAVNYPYAYTVGKDDTPTTATYTSGHHGGSNYYEAVPKKYQYGYRVSNPHTSTEFGHSEVNDGHSAKGVYHVLLPDGRLQNVKYWAGPSGYHATITYDHKF